jgi:hypothetical protein
MKSLAFVKRNTFRLLTLFVKNVGTTYDNHYQGISYYYIG